MLPFQFFESLIASGGRTWFRESDFVDAPPGLPRLFSQRVGKGYRPPIDETNNAVLYHYTSEQTLEKIVSSKELWLTSYHRLKEKDPAEIEHGRETLKRVIDSVSAPLCAEDACLLGDILKYVYSDAAGEYYICCFTLNSDSDYHWANYGDNGRGVALGIPIYGRERNDPFWGLGSLPNIASIDYSLNAQRAAIVTDLKNAIDCWRLYYRYADEMLNVHAHWPHYSEYNSLEKIYGFILAMACDNLIITLINMKNPELRQEKEVRFSFYIAPTSQEHILEKNRDILYVNPQEQDIKEKKISTKTIFQFRRAVSGAESHSRYDLPISDLVLGPSASAGAVNFAKDCLDRHGYESTIIRRSTL